MPRKIDLFRAIATGEESEKIQEVLASHWWAQGAKVAQFEKEWAAFTGQNML
jgi:dTDP-4-amino-4,6-dideoxygalactose transaminase